MTESKGIQIEILKTCKGTPDGWRVLQFTEGQIYESTPSLARTLISQGAARVTGEQTRRYWEDLDRCGWRKVSIDGWRRAYANDPLMLAEFNGFVRGRGYEAE